jgi:hypothetical protein
MIIIRLSFPVVSSSKIGAKKFSAEKNFLTKQKQVIFVRIRRNWPALATLATSIGG